MTPLEIGIIFFVILLILLAASVPIGVSMAICGFAGMWTLISLSAALGKLAYVPFEILANYNFAVLPLFLLMAQVCTESGISANLFDAASKWFGRLPGGLSVAAIGACTGMGAVSGSAIATAATVGLVAAPEMEKHKYKPTLITGSLAAGGTMGIMVPPSGVLILYGLLTEVSISKLFVSTMIPGLIVALCYIMAVIIWCKVKPDLAAPVPGVSFREKVRSLGGCGDILALVVIVLAGLIAGLFTPTEAGAIGASGSILITALRRKLTLQKFKKACIGTLRTSGMVYTILIGAFIFNYFIAATNGPMMIAEYVTGLKMSTLGIIVVIVFIYIFLGIIMDEAAMIVLTIPIFFPVITTLGISPLWFGVLVARVTEIGMISPPLGDNHVCHFRDN